MSDKLPRSKCASFVFPSERVVLINSLALSGSFRINSSALEANAARPSIDAFQTSFNGFSSFICSVTSTVLLPSQLYLVENAASVIWSLHRKISTIAD